MSRVVLVAALMVFFASAYGAAQQHPHPGGSPNVLLITIDTLRADHLSCYGYHLQTSPHLDRLASHGVRFENAYTAIPLTGPSHISMMTGLFPQQHGATINGTHIGAMMHTKHPPLMLAQVLHRLRRYTTAAFVSAWPLKAQITGLGQGFGTYNQKLEYHYNVLSAARSATDVGPLSRKWIRKHAADQRPFFLWVHYFDPHAPYELHSEFASLPSNPNADGEDVPRRKQSMGALAKIRAYDSEIAFTDKDIGKTLKLLDEEGLKDNTFIFVVADHGEALGEHGDWGHGNKTEQGVVHVPMIAYFPGVLPQGKSIAQDVSLVDLMPTVLDYTGVQLGLQISGKSLRPLIEAEGGEPQLGPAFFVTYAEPPLHLPRWVTWMWTWARSKRTPAQMGFVRGNVKVVSIGGRRMQLFRLNDQFKWEQSVTGDAAVAAKEKDYREYLTAWFRRTNTGAPGEAHLTGEDRDMLRSLGYQP